ncbi:MAG: hypothetical protein WC972_14040 [Trueperaceae bacterium]
MPAPKSPPAGITFTLTSHRGPVTAIIEAALERALNRMALPWHEEATNEVPVDTGRLKSSLTFSTPTIQKAVAYTDHDGKGASFRPPKPPPLTLLLGTNVEYAAAVHEGINWEGGPVQIKEHTVKAHTVKAHTRTTKTGKEITVKAHTVKAHTVKAHTRNMPAVTRAGKKFIEGPGRRLRPRFEQIAAEELAKATS